MPAYHPVNERMKHRYLSYLREAGGRSEATIDGVAAALRKFEVYTRCRDFRSFHIEQAAGFKRMLAEQLSQRTGEPLSKGTMLSTLRALRDFFRWLSREPGYRSRVTYSDADYFNLSARDIRIAKAKTEKRVPTIEQILHILKCMPATSEIDRRNRAVIAFCLLTGARDGAIASFKLKHLDVVGGKVVQDAREVRTKFAKTFTSSFFPVPEEVRQIVIEWVQFLVKERRFGPDDPLFPSTDIGLCNRKFTAIGLSRSPWSTTAPIRRIFKEAFARAGLPYANPHTLRNTLVQLGQRLCRTPEEFKAWSQNLGHDGVLVTFSCYGQVPQERQAELISQLHQNWPAGPRIDAGIHELLKKWLQSEALGSASPGF